MFSTCSNQGHANQNYAKNSSYSSHNGNIQGYEKKKKKLTAGEGVGEKGTLVHCCWECRLVQPVWKVV